MDEGHGPPTPLAATRPALDSCRVPGSDPLVPLKSAPAAARSLFHVAESATPRTLPSSMSAAPEDPAADGNERQLPVSDARYAHVYDRSTAPRTPTSAQGLFSSTELTSPRTPPSPEDRHAIVERQPFQVPDARYAHVYDRSTAPRTPTSAQGLFCNMEPTTAEDPHAIAERQPLSAAARLLPSAHFAQDNDRPEAIKDFASWSATNDPYVAAKAPLSSPSSVWQDLPLASACPSMDLTQQIMDRPFPLSASLTGSNSLPVAAKSLPLTSPAKLDLPAVFERLDASNLSETTEQVNGRPVTLLLGHSNAGKTTTALFLHGTSLRRRQHETLVECDGKHEPTYKEVIDTMHPVEGFVVGHSADSTTPTVRALECLALESIIIDVPGFGDHTGAAADVAHGLMIASVLRHGGSVTPVLLIDARTIAVDNGRSFEHVLKCLAACLNPIQSFLPSISFLFTHIEAGQTVSSIKNNILHFLQAAHVQADATLKATVSAIVKFLNTHQNMALLTMDRLEGSPDFTHRLLNTASPLQLDATFPCPLGPEALTFLNDACRAASSVMAYQLQHHSYTPVGEQLDYLHQMAKLSLVPDVLEIHGQACRNVDDHLVAIKATAADHLDPSQPPLRPEAMARALTHLRDACALRSRDPALPTIYDQSLQQLDQWLTDMVQDVLAESSLMPAQRGHLDTLQLAMKHLPEFLRGANAQAYDLAKMHVTKRWQRAYDTVDLALLQAKDGTDPVPWREVVAALKDLRLGAKHLSAHLPETGKEDFVRKLVDLLSASLAEASALVDHVQQCNLLPEHENSLTASLHLLLDSFAAGVEAELQLPPGHALQDCAGSLAARLHQVLKTHCQIIQTGIAQSNFASCLAPWRTLRLASTCHPQLQEHCPAGLETMLSHKIDQLREQATKLVSTIEEGKSMDGSTLADHIAVLQAVQALDVVTPQPMAGEAIALVVPLVTALYRRSAAQVQQQAKQAKVESDLQPLVSMITLLDALTPLREVLPELLAEQQDLFAVLSGIVDSLCTTFSAAALRGEKLASRFCMTDAWLQLLEQHMVPSKFAVGQEDTCTFMSRLLSDFADSLLASARQGLQEYLTLSRAATQDLSSERLKTVLVDLRWLKSAKRLDCRLEGQATSVYEMIAAELKTAFKDFNRQALVALEDGQLADMHRLRTFFEQAKLDNLEEHFENGGVPLGDWVTELVSQSGSNMTLVRSQVKGLLASSEYFALAQLLRPFFQSGAAGDKKLLAECDVLIRRHLTNLEPMNLSLPAECAAADSSDMRSTLLGSLRSAVEARVLSEMITYNVSALVERLSDEVNECFESTAASFLSHVHRFELTSATPLYAQLMWFKRFDRLPSVFTPTFMQRLQPVYMAIQELPSKAESVLADALKVGPNFDFSTATPAKIDKVLAEMKRADGRALGFDTLIDLTSLHAVVEERILHGVNAIQRQVQEARVDHSLDQAEAGLRLLRRLNSSPDLGPLKVHLQSVLDQETRNMEQARKVAEEVSKAPMLGRPAPEQLKATLRRVQLDDAVAYDVLKRDIIDSFAKDLERLQQLELPSIAQVMGTLPQTIMRMARHHVELSEHAVTLELPELQVLHKESSNALVTKIMALADLCVDPSFCTPAQGTTLMQHILSLWRDCADSVCAEHAGGISAILESQTESLRATTEALQVDLVALRDTDLQQAGAVTSKLLGALDRLKAHSEAETAQGLTVQDAQATGALECFKAKIQELEAMAEAWVTASAGEPSTLSRVPPVLGNVRALEKVPQLACICAPLRASVMALLKTQTDEIRGTLSGHFVAREYDAFTILMRHAEAVDQLLATLQELEPITEAILRQVQTFLVEEFKKHKLDNLKDFAELLVSLKQAVRDIGCFSVQHMVQQHVAKEIERAYRQKRDCFYELGKILADRHGALGAEFVQERHEFHEVYVEARNKATSQMTSEHALNALAAANPGVDVKPLRTLLMDFEDKYAGFMDKYLFAFATRPCEELVAHVITLTRNGAAGGGAAPAPQRLYARACQSFPELLAAIFAVWSIMDSAETFAVHKQHEAVKRPHVVQVLAIMRMLGLDVPDSSLLRRADAFRASLGAAVMAPPQPEGHLVELGTGEGKSVVLGVLGTCLALLGFQVYSACYSENLCERDRLDFDTLFWMFGLEKHIQYDTITKLTDRMLNAPGDLRSATLKLVKKEEFTAEATATGASKRPSILLLDEVDTFFNSDCSFFGNTYNSVTHFVTADTQALFKYVWQHRREAAKIALPLIKAQTAYASLLAQLHVDLHPFVDEQISQMLHDLKAQASRAYSIKDGCVAYPKHDGMTTSFFYNYETAFHYLDAFDKGDVAEDILLNKLGFMIRCGDFSYAALPKEFDGGVLGITGTLGCLEADEVALIEKRLGLKRRTIMPSIYGSSKRDFQPKQHVQVFADEDRYYQLLVDSILEVQKEGRPVLVFFETKQKLAAFQESTYGQRLGSVSVVMEETPSENLPHLVRRAADAQRISLWTRCFGRGLDFVSLDAEINRKGGVHVIQTFFAASASEELQVMGRTARQGQRGSYRMHLLESDLTSMLDLSADELKKAAVDGGCLSLLHAARTTITKARVANMTTAARAAKDRHKLSMVFRRKAFDPEVSQSDKLAALLELQ